MGIVHLKRGFFINKILLDAHGISMREDAISELRFGRLVFLLSVCLFGCEICNNVIISVWVVTIFKNMKFP